MTLPLSHQPKDKRCRHPDTNMMPTKALGLTAQNTMALCLPAIDLIMIHAIEKDPSGNRSDSTASDEPKNSNGNRLSEARAKSPRAKDMWNQHLQATSLLSLKDIIMRMMIQIALVFMQLAMKSLHLNRRLMICTA